MSTPDWPDQVCYQVFVRSFCDGNGDGIGDFRGLESKLDFLADLGVTSLWLNPIHPSPSHHNYFTTDFFGTDPDYGTLAEFADLCRAVHVHDMRILIDMETQYLLRDHPWARDVLANPGSPHRRRFVFGSPGARKPVHLRLGMGEGRHKQVFDVPDAVTLNLRDAEVIELQRRIYAHWLDPLGGGDRNAGVDGFRLDHVMDDLDHRGHLTNLLAGFWRPLLEHLRDLDPELYFLAEPAQWADTGKRLFTEADMDGIFAMPLMFAIRSLGKRRIATAIEATLEALPTGKQVFTVIENHDMSRFASAVGEDAGKERLGAALLLTLPGVPTLYYGQEIGMVGDLERGLRQVTAGSRRRDDPMVKARHSYHLPAREAFRWSHDADAPGMATWYRDRPFWGHTALRKQDGRTFGDQDDDPDSLLNWYRRLITLRRDNVALRRGNLAIVPTGHGPVLAFLRRHPEQTVLVAVNLNGKKVTASPDLKADGPAAVAGGANLLGGAPWRATESIHLDPYELKILQLDRKT